MDRIQRELGSMDDPLGRLEHPLFGGIPLLIPALGLMSGILVQDRYPLHQCVYLACIGLICCVAVLVVCIKDRTGWLVPMAGICFLCLGALRVWTFGLAQPDDIRHLVQGEDRRLATLRGLIMTEPAKEPNQWTFAPLRQLPPSTSFYLAVRRVQSHQGWTSVRGIVRVTVGEPVDDLQVGQTILVHGWISRAAPASNPGQFDMAQFLARRNIFVTAYVKSRASIEALDTIEEASWLRLTHRIRQLASWALVGEDPSTDGASAILKAFLLGKRADIDPHTYRAFRTTGLLHYLSLSGMHVGIIAGILWCLGRIAGLLTPARALISAIALGVFLLMIQPQAPAIRAVIMGWCFCAAAMARRRSNPLNALSLAAILLLLVRPTQLFDVGWQLSFGCMAGIFILHRAIHSRMQAPLARVSGRSQIADRILGGLASSLSIGMAAWLGGAGIMLYHFHTITPLSTVWTLLVLPLVALILFTGLLKIVLSACLGLGSAMGWLATALAHILITAVRWIAQIDPGPIRIGQVSVAMAVLYYCLLGCLATQSWRRPWVQRAIVWTLAASVGTWLGMLVWQRMAPGELTLTCLDVGHGQAIVAELPQGNTILFDAGSLYKDDVGSRVVNPFLDFRGIDRLDAVVLGHMDLDHINGAPEVLDERRPAALLVNDRPGPGKDPGGVARLWRTYLDHAGLRPVRPPSLLHEQGPVRMEVLWPVPSSAKNMSDNDLSLVTMIRCGPAEILLCSDIEQGTQARILELYPALKADVLVVPHHGSTRTLIPGFIEQLDPLVLICSCGRSQVDNGLIVQPTGRTPVFCTGRDGAITVRIDTSGGIHIRGFLTKQQGDWQRTMDD